MSGSAATRGFLIQALATLLEIMTSDFRTVSVEPNVGDEKVDFLVRSDDSSLAVQVKSSDTHFTYGQAKQWAEDLEAANPGADRLELVLFGPHAKSLRNAQSFGSVRVAPPRELNLPLLLKSAAHSLDLYLTKRGISAVPPMVRELLVAALSTRVLELGTTASELTREQLDDQLRTWVLLEYPPAIELGLSRRLDVLADTAFFWPSNGELAIGFGLTFVNAATVPIIVDDVFARISSDSLDLQLRAGAWNPGVALAHPDVGNESGPVVPFTAFAVPQNSVVEKGALLLGPPTPIQLADFRAETWGVSIHLAYRRLDVPLLEAEMELTIDQRIVDDLRSGTAKFTRAGRELVI